MFLKGSTTEICTFLARSGEAYEDMGLFFLSVCIPCGEVRVSNVYSAIS